MRKTALLLCVIALFAASCGGGDGDSNPDESGAPTSAIDSTTTSTPTPTAETLSEPTPATPTSAPPDSEQEITGELIYASQCATCHSPDGSGGKGVPLNDASTLHSQTREDMIRVVSEGIPGGDMKAYAQEFGGILTPDQIELVVDYVRQEFLSEGTGTVSSNAAATDIANPTDIPQEVSNLDWDWPLPNRDYASTRSIQFPQSSISSENVWSLQEFGRYQTPGGDFYGNLATAVVIIGSTAYVQERTGVVHAVDIPSNQAIWKVGNPFSGTMFGPNGVAVGWGKVFAPKIGPSRRGELIAAYDASTGEELWATDITEGDSEINIQPLAYGGLVYAATSGFPAGHIGTIFALDEATGEVVWKFATVEDENLWGRPDINSGGGAWYPPAIDTETDTLYFGIGNPYPFPGIKGFPAGASRPGDNRWTNSTIALDAKTGELKWGFQAFPHDIFDRDHVIVALAEVVSEGETQKVVISTGKGAVVFGLDAKGGEQLWRTPVGLHWNDDLESFDEPTIVLPGAQGGIVTPIATADGVAYVSVVNAPIEYKNDETSSTGSGTALLSYPSNLVAIDAATGEIIWDTEISNEFLGIEELADALQIDATDVFGGTTVVNDLVFSSTLTGQLFALDRETGDLAWVHQADAGLNGWPAVAGDLIVFPVGFSSEISGVGPHLLSFMLANQPRKRPATGS